MDEASKRQAGADEIPPPHPPINPAVILATTSVALATLAAVVALIILAPEQASLATSIMAAAGSFITALLALQAKNEVGVVRQVVYARVSLMVQKLDALKAILEARRSAGEPDRPPGPAGEADE